MFCLNICELTVCAVPGEARRGRQILELELQAMWVLRTEPRY